LLDLFSLSLTTQCNLSFIRKTCHRLILKVIKVKLVRGFWCWKTVLLSLTNRNIANIIRFSLYSMTLFALFKKVKILLGHQISILIVVLVSFLKELFHLLIVSYLLWILTLYCLKIMSSNYFFTLSGINLLFALILILQVVKLMI